MKQACFNQKGLLRALEAHSAPIEWVAGGAVNSASDASASILFLGDTVLSGNVGRLIEQYGITYPFAKCPGGFFDATAVCWNLECCVSERGSRAANKVIAFRARPRSLGALQVSRAVQVLNHANNHFLDFGADAAMDTLRLARERGMVSFGVAPASLNSGAIVETAAGAIGLLGLAPCARPLAEPAPINLESSSVSRMARRVQELRPLVDVLVVSLHQGVEYCSYPLRTARRACHAAVDAGADCVIGHHAHLLQGIEVYRGVPIFHNIGGFLCGELDRMRHPQCAVSCAVRVHISACQVVRVALQFVSLNDNWQPVPLAGELHRRVALRVRDLSVILERPIRAYATAQLAQVRRIQARVLPGREARRCEEAAVRGRRFLRPD